MNISYEGIGHLAVTIPAGSCAEGHICRVNAMGQAASCIEGDKFCGFVEAMENGMAAVQLDGFAKVDYSGSTPALGYSGLSANGKGGIKADTAGKEYLVVAVDTTEMTVVIKL